ncbi:hypothetical protein AB4Z22_30485, partial [Paenibacillus sp. TAF58]
MKNTTSKRSHKCLGELISSKDSSAHYSKQRRIFRDASVITRQTKYLQNQSKFMKPKENFYAHKKIISVGHNDR